MQAQQYRTNNFTSSDEFSGVFDSGVIKNYLFTRVYMTSSEVKLTSENKIESDFSDSQLTHLCGEISYTAFAENWENEDDEYWASYLK